MLNLDATDNFEGIASVTNVVEFTFSGVDGTTVVSKEGKLTDGQTTIHTATGITRVYSLTLVNTHSAAVTVTVTKDPANAGTLYKLFSISLGIGYSLVFDGARFAVFDANGVLMQGSGVSDIAYAASWDGVTNIAPSKNAVYDQTQLQMLKTGSNLAIGSDADGDMYYRASSVLARLAKGAANTKLFINAGATAPEWAAGISIKDFTRAVNAAAGNVAYTGAGFKPSAVIAVMTKHESANIFSLGGAVGTADFVIDLAPLAVPVWEYAAGYLVRLITNTAGTEYQVATVASMDSDGMTLTWISAGAGAGTLSGFFIYLR